LTVRPRGTETWYRNTMRPRCLLLIVRPRRTKTLYAHGFIVDL